MQIWTTLDLINIYRTLPPTTSCFQTYLEHLPRCTVFWTIKSISIHLKWFKWHSMSSDHCGAELKINIKRSLKILKYLETEQHVSEQHRKRKGKLKNIFNRTKMKTQHFKMHWLCERSAREWRVLPGTEEAGLRLTSASIWKQKKSSKLNPKC